MCGENSIYNAYYTCTKVVEFYRENPLLGTECMWLQLRVCLLACLSACVCIVVSVRVKPTFFKLRFINLLSPESKKKIVSHLIFQTHIFTFKSERDFSIPFERNRKADSKRSRMKNTVFAHRLIFQWKDFFRAFPISQIRKRESARVHDVSIRMNWTLPFTYASQNALPILHVECFWVGCAYIVSMIIKMNLS